MSSPFWDQVEDAFAEGRRASESERAALLISCEADVAERVRSLWEAFDQGKSFLDNGTDNSSATARKHQSVGGGRFTVLDLLGAGGMGEVFRARDEKLGRVVALKFLSPEFALQSESRRRLEKEAHAICALAHPHVCTLHDVCWEDDAPFLVMECLEGETLAQRLTLGRMRVSELIPLALQMIDALAHAHERGIVHRDFKPGNVMLTPHGVKVVDFGIAKLSNSHSQRHSQTTSEGVIAGSASYMSPEQIDGKPVDQRSDIFSLGCVLYEMITGRKAFHGESRIDVLAAVLRQEPARIEDIVHASPKGLVECVARCLEKKPEDRFQSLIDVRAVLSGIAVSTPSNQSIRSIAFAESVASGAFAMSRSKVIAWLGICAATAFALWLVPDRTAIAHHETDSVVVLPFVNVQNDPELEYLAEGVSESITNALSRLKSVRVVARATAFSHKNSDTDIRKVGHELNARAVVTGRVLRSRDQVRIQADLVDAVAGKQVWGQQYETTLGDILHVQQDVAQNVRQHLVTGKGDSGSAGAAFPSTANSQAYEWYLRGRYALSRYSVADIQRAIEFFQHALELDPRYALAHAGIADSYLGLSGMYLRPRDAMAKARASALRALEFDADLADAHVSLALILSYFDFDWKQAEQHLDRARDLRPLDASVQLWHGWTRFYTGRTEIGIAEAQRAHELDPLSSFVETGLGQMYYLSDQHAMAVQRLRAVVASDPKFFNGRYHLGVAYLHSGQYDQAIRELESAVTIDGEQPQPLGYLAFAYAKRGDTAAARGNLTKLEKLHESRYVSGYWLAVASVGLGARDDAVRWLDIAYEDRDDALSLLGTDCVFDELRTDSRVLALLRQIGLPTPS
jgi:serine/threonine protein kinase/tetratricopeptide (TPR) repeat protein